MVNSFLKRFGFGGGEQAQEAAHSVRDFGREQEEILRVRDVNFSRAVSEFLHRQATATELEQARAAVNGGDSRKPLEPMSKEEMVTKVSRVAEKFGWTSEALAPNPDAYIPMQEEYPPMGERRQRAFEVAFEDALGGDVSKTDIKIARAMFEADPDIAKAWPTMAGEEVANYARSLAKRMLDRERAAAAK